MVNGCFLLCSFCKKETIYIKNAENKCFFCDERLFLEKGVEDLVIALNNEGVITTTSCEGHPHGFEEEKRSYPYVAFLNTPKCYDMVEEIVGNYNEMVKKKDWQIRFERTTSGIATFIAPTEFWKETVILQKKAKDLAKNIVFVGQSS